MARSAVVVRVGPCPRCGDDHLRIEARSFIQPSRNAASHWAICPTTADPLLIEYDPDGECQEAA